jgi:hypothetical protein
VLQSDRRFHKAALIAQMPGIPLSGVWLWKRGRRARGRQPAPSRINRRHVPHVPPKRTALQDEPRTRFADDPSDKHLVVLFEFECRERFPIEESSWARPEAEANSRRVLRERAVDVVRL